MIKGSITITITTYIIVNNWRQIYYKQIISHSYSQLEGSPLSITIKWSFIYDSNVTKCLVILSQLQSNEALFMIQMWLKAFIRIYLQANKSIWLLGCNNVLYAYLVDAYIWFDFEQQYLIWYWIRVWIDLSESRNYFKLFMDCEH